MERQQANFEKLF